MRVLAHEQALDSRLNVAASLLESADVEGAIVEAHVLKLLELDRIALLGVLHGRNATKHTAKGHAYEGGKVSMDSTLTRREKTSTAAELKLSLRGRASSGGSRARGSSGGGRTTCWGSALWSGSGSTAI